MYTIFDKEKPGEYAIGFLNNIEELGSMQYDKSKVIELLSPSFADLEEKQKVTEDLLTPGSILFRHYEHGRLSVEYRKEYRLANSKSYRIEKLTEDKIDEFYGL